jgi:hypothetical protein
LPRSPEILKTLAAVAILLATGLATGHMISHNATEQHTTNFTPSYCGVYCVINDFEQYIDLYSPDQNLTEKNLSSFKILDLNGKKIHSAIGDYDIAYDFKTQIGPGMFSKNLNTTVLNLNFYGSALGARLKTDRCLIRIATKGAEFHPIEIRTFPTNFVGSIWVAIHSTGNDIKLDLNLNSNDGALMAGSDEWPNHMFSYTLFNERRTVVSQDQSKYPRMINGTYTERSSQVFSIDKNTIALNERHTIDIDFTINGPDNIYTGYIHNIPFIPADLQVSPWGGE